MAIHLVKLSVGTQSVETLTAWVKKRTAVNKRSGRGPVHDHVTRMSPRRSFELLDGGSIYWVIKGIILARQRIVALEPERGADGINRCAILLDPPLIETEAQPRRAFQGWRYLPEEDAPRDLREINGQRTPPALRAALAELGLL